MVRQLNIFAISFVVCISSISIADGWVLGSYLPLPSDHFDSLKSNLESANMNSAFGGASVRILDILSAKHQLGASNPTYRILATISINGRTEKCCIDLLRTFNREFIVAKAKVGAQKCN